MEDLNYHLDGMEPREYQINIFKEVWLKNSIVVLPTGLGKTVIAAMAASRTMREGRGKVMFLAPTKPLVDQHFSTMKKLLNLSNKEICILTGDTDAASREELWIQSSFVVCTPQIAWNDLKKEIYSVEKFGLIIFDEVHRAVGNYQYVEVAQKFLEVRNRMILGLTASPGSSMDKLTEITKSLGIEKVKIKTEDDPDVRKYINDIRINITRIRQPDEVREIYAVLKQIYSEIIEKLKKSGILQNTGISRKNLIEASREVSERARNGENKLFSIIPYITAAIRVDYAMEYLESQGYTIFYNYFNDLIHSGDKSIMRTVAIIEKSHNFNVLMRLIETTDISKVENPKCSIALRICEETIQKNKDSRIIIFTHYRKTSEIVTAYFTEHSSVIKPVRFVGQATHDSDIGLTRSEQHRIIEQFRDGTYNVLVATSVAEEGLDIPATDLVIFYEPVPSDIRTIQRRGRTGRSHAGEVHILTYEGSRDIGYLFSARRKENQMKSNIAKLRDEIKKAPSTLYDYFS